MVENKKNDRSDASLHVDHWAMITVPVRLTVTPLCDNNQKKDISLLKLRYPAHKNA